MEQGETLNPPLKNHINDAAYESWKDIVEIYRSRKTSLPSSGSERKQARDLGLQFAITQGGHLRYRASATVDVEGRTNLIKEAETWEEPAKLASVGDWTKLKERLNSHVQDLIEETRVEKNAPSKQEELNSFTILANLIST